jgi:hypothetical protein
MLWPDPKDADIKLSIEEKYAAYGSQTLKEIFEKKNQSAPSARAEIARQEKVAKRTAPRKVQAKGKGKTTKNKGKGKAKASSVDEDYDEDSDFEMGDVESEHTLIPPPPCQAPSKRPRTPDESQSSSSKRHQEHESEQLLDDGNDDSYGAAEDDEGLESGSHLAKRAKIDKGKGPGAAYTLKPSAPHRNAEHPF